MGSTEMLNKYCSNRPGRIAPGTSGWPVPGCELRLVDEKGTVLRGPAIGELQVHGDSRAAYYWHRQEQTDAAMLGEWFVTGDRCERREDGTYTYLGRVDDMLRVGGLWVSPPNVEQALIEHEHVVDAGVTGVALAGTSGIVAYVECADGSGSEALANELREWCRQRLASHECPHFVTFVDELPRTQNGKLQRFQLRRWASEIGGNKAKLVSALARTWSGVLDADVSGDEDFFALGGDSLSAAELVVAIEQDLGIQLSMADLMAAPTVDELAHFLAADGERRAANVPVRASHARSRGSSLFLVPPLGGSVFQFRALADAVGDGVVIYGIPAWERIPSALSVEDEARYLVDGLRSVQEYGPYRLGGHSGGGAVAWEMACVLEEQGERVEAVVILDTLVGSGRRARPMPRPTIPKLTAVPLGRRLTAYLRGLHEPRLVLPRVSARLGLAGLIDRVVWTVDLSRHGAVRPSKRYAYRWVMTGRALEHYSPSPCQAPVILLRSPDTQDERSDRIWAAIAKGGLTIQPVDIPHDYLLDDHCAVPLAAALRAACPFIQTPVAA